jgi:hypothetical protein
MPTASPPNELNSQLIKAVGIVVAKDLVKETGRTDQLRVDTLECLCSISYSTSKLTTNASPYFKFGKSISCC